MTITGLKTNGGTKAATVYEVARLAGVSHMTVTRTFSGKQSVADDTRQRVLDAAERLGYRPNMLAKGLRGGRTRTIAAIWQQMGALYSSAIVGEISNRAVAEDYQFSVIDSMGGPEALERTIGDCRVRGVEGLVLYIPSSMVNVRSHLAAKQWQKLLDGFRSTVLVADRPVDVAVNEVVWDRTASVRAIVDHFIKTCRRKPAIMLPMAGNRYKAEVFAEQCAAHGIELPRKAIIDVGTISNSELSDLTEFPAFLEDHFSKNDFDFDAVFCTCDEFAASLSVWLRRRGMRVPDDVAIVGFNNTAAAKLADVPLASVDRAYLELSAVIRDVLFAGLDEPDTPVVQKSMPMKFVWRQSAG